MSRVNDVGETYYSCVQCGHTMPEASARRAEPRRSGIVPAVPMVARAA